MTVSLKLLNYIINNFYYFTKSFSPTIVNKFRSSSNKLWFHLGVADSSGVRHRLRRPGEYNRGVAILRKSFDQRLWIYATRCERVSGSRNSHRFYGEGVIHTPLYTYMLYIHIYIYIEREREREREKDDRWHEYRENS